MTIQETNFKNDQEYHDLIGLSQTALKHFKEHPILFWRQTPLNPNREREAPTDAMVQGTLFHLMILEPEKFDKEFIVADWGAKSRKTVKYKNFVEALREQGDDRIVISQEELELGADMKEALSKTKLANDLLINSRKELPIVWEEFGLVFKGKPDGLNDFGGGIYSYTDYKTTGKFKRNPNPDREGYLLQAVAYKRGLKAKYDIDISEFNFVIQSTKDPELITVVCIKDYEMKNAEIEFESLILQIKDCLIAVRKTAKKSGDILDVFRNNQTQPIEVESGLRYNKKLESFAQYKEEQKELNNYTTETDLVARFEIEWADKLRFE